MPSTPPAVNGYLRIAHQALGQSGRALLSASISGGRVMCSLFSIWTGSGGLAGERITLIDQLEERGIAFRALNAPMDTTTPTGRAFLQIQAAFAEMERNIIRQRVNEGLAAARARGRRGGRPRVMTPEKLSYARHLMGDSTRSIPDICKELGGIRPSTLYHYLRADGSLKTAGRDLLEKAGKEEGTA